MKWIARCKQHLTWQRIGVAVGAVLTALAGSSYDLGTISVLIPPAWKPIVFIVMLTATSIVHVLPRRDRQEKPNEPTTSVNYFITNYYDNKERK